MNEVLFNKAVKSVPCLMSHVDSSFVFNGMWNHECAVLPQSSKRSVIPHDTIASTIFHSDRIFVVTAFHR
jgi:hypothetical protein